MYACQYLYSAPTTLSLPVFEVIRQKSMGRLRLNLSSQGYIRTFLEGIEMSHGSLWLLVTHAVLIFIDLMLWSQNIYWPLRATGVWLFHRVPVVKLCDEVHSMCHPVYWSFQPLAVSVTSSPNLLLLKLPNKSRVYETCLIMCWCHPAAFVCMYCLYLFLYPPSHIRLERFQVQSSWFDNGWQPCLPRSFSDSFAMAISQVLV